MSVKEHLAMADSVLSKIVVSGDNVMLLAMARQELKAAFEALKEEENVDSEQSN